MLFLHCRLIIILSIYVWLTLTLAKVCPHSYLITVSPLQGFSSGETPWYFLSITCLYFYLFQKPLPLPTTGILGVIASTFGFFFTISFSSTVFQNPSIPFPISSPLSNFFHLSSSTHSSSSLSFLNFSTSFLQSIFFFSLYFPFFYHSPLPNSFISSIFFYFSFLQGFYLSLHCYQLFPFYSCHFF